MLRVTAQQRYKVSLGLHPVLSASSFRKTRAGVTQLNISAQGHTQEVALLLSAVATATHSLCKSLMNHSHAGAEIQYQSCPKEGAHFFQYNSKPALQNRHAV